MTEAGGGEYEVSLGAAGTGVYRITVRAEGGTFRGARFTREALLTAAVQPGGDRPDPDIPHDSRQDRETDWCHLVECLGEKGIVSRELQKRWLEYGVDLDRLRECVKETCTR